MIQQAFAIADESLAMVQCRREGMIEPGGWLNGVA